MEEKPETMYQGRVAPSKDYVVERPAGMLGRTMVHGRVLEEIFTL